MKNRLSSLTLKIGCLVLLLFLGVSMSIQENPKAKATEYANYTVQTPAPTPEPAEDEIELPSINSPFASNSQTKENDNPVKKEEEKSLMEEASEGLMDLLISNIPFILILGTLLVVLLVITKKSADMGVKGKKDRF